MLSHAHRWNGWRGICLIALTYVYFLIFAQFAFLKRLAELGIEDMHLKAVMTAMAAGGIALSLLASRRPISVSPHRQLQSGLVLCTAAALLSLLPLNPEASVAVSLLIGSGLGLVTVTLVSRLDLWIGTGAVFLKVGLGTGLGYLLCNVPGLFDATPKRQAMAAACLCLLGIFCASKQTSLIRSPVVIPSTKVPPFLMALVAFTALIWLDSAAFFIIQNTPELKAGTWQGTLHLWSNGILHFLAAMASAWLLGRRSLSVVLSMAFLCLAAACLLLLDPHRLVLASFFYPIGVSLYSVALVAYPSLLMSGTLIERARRTGIIYAVAGWGGSAMGIGMAQHLGHVPPIFVAAAGVLILGHHVPRFVDHHMREVAVVGAILLLALFCEIALEDSHGREITKSAIERGRSVYISEGCIHCHSQYVRPGTLDVAMWGPTQTIEEVHAQRPPLIGNRRQGPDLSEIGGRRSQLWLKAHFYNPREVSYGSFMPTYAYLFQAGKGRGEDLMAYLSSLHSTGTQEHIKEERLWRPAVMAARGSSLSEGASLFVKECATCHSPDGATRRRWHGEFQHLPTELMAGEWHDVQPLDPTGRVAQIIKFGMPGTDMPGHEYLTDQQVLSLVAWLKSTRSSKSILESGSTDPGIDYSSAHP